MPAGVVTNTLAFPAVPGSVVHVIEVAVLAVRLRQELPPTVTAVAPVKSVPAIVMVVPPSVGPVLGETALTVGVDAGGVTVIDIAEIVALVVPPHVVQEVELAVPLHIAGVPAVNVLPARQALTFRLYD